MTTSITNLLSGVTDELRARRARRHELARLRAELSAYTSPADRQELDAIIARHDEGEVADIDRIVTRLRAA
jgi:hypothetical protein